MKILVIGASGFLGNKIADMLSKKHKIIGTYFSKKQSDYIHLDITSEEQVEQIFNKVKPQVVIQTSALVNVELSEINKEMASNINVRGTKNIVNACKKIKAKLIYISTDYVFDGHSGPYTEESIPNPINYYGKTKLEGEKIVENELSDYIIIRPAIMYGYNSKYDKPNFVAVTVSKLKNDEKINVDDKRTKYPTLIDDIAEATSLLIEKNCSGIYNVSGDEAMTKYEWALKIADIFNLPRKNILPCTVKEKVPKPIDVKLTTTKIKKLSMQFTGIEEGLKKVKRHMQN